jgi:N-acyl-phosphatidylethanolamine-hydrolysing phospholipase D
VSIGRIAASGFGSSLPQVRLIESVHLLIVSHFDHLDPEAIHELGDSCEWIVPIGVGPFIREHGVTRVTELE